MALKGAKTPIAYLYELAQKEKYKPIYEEIDQKGQVHDPIYFFQCTAGGFTARGEGSKKKEAKHAAALSVLKQMDNGTGTILCDLSQVSDEGCDGNPVGQLQEYTQQQKWAPPDYAFVESITNITQQSKEFVCNVKLGSFLEKGIGKSKKSAKRKAAQALLQRLKAGVTLNAEEMGPCEDLEGKGSYTALKEGKRIPTITKQASKQIAQFYDKMKNTPGRYLSALHNKATLTTPAANYCQMLQQIAEEQGFEVTYVDLQEPNISGQRQCLVQLSTMPVAVCHGYGHAPDDSHAQAAYTALQYLKIMTKKG